MFFKGLAFLTCPNLAVKITCKWGCKIWMIGPLIAVGPNQLEKIRKVEHLSCRLLLLLNAAQLTYVDWK